MPRSSNFAHRYGAALASLLALGVLSWWLVRPSRTPEELPACVAAAPVPKIATTPHVAAAITPVDSSPDGAPIHPAGSTDVAAVGMRPHPITPTHERIFRENSLIGDLNGALDVKDFVGLRALLKQYRDEFPEDANVLQDGYELIANCQERLTPEARAAAQRYYDAQLDSGLRRYIRRHCLEQEPLAASR